MISVTATRVVMDRALYRALVQKMISWRQIVFHLRGQLADEHALLLTALHQLAMEKGKEPLYFTQRWLRDHRRVPDPVPVTRTRHTEGGEARGRA